MSVEKIYAVNAIRKLCGDTKYKEVARRKSLMAHMILCLLLAIICMLRMLIQEENARIQMFTSMNTVVAIVGKGE